MIFVNTGLAIFPWGLFDEVGLPRGSMAITWTRSLIAWAISMIHRLDDHGSCPRGTNASDTA
jgi:hypothetical protein